MGFYPSRGPAAIVFAADNLPPQSPKLHAGVESPTPPTPANKKGGAHGIGQASTSGPPLPTNPPGTDETPNPARAAGVLSASARFRNCTRFPSTPPAAGFRPTPSGWCGKKTTNILSWTPKS